MCASARLDQLRAARETLAFLIQLLDIEESISGLTGASSEEMQDHDRLLAELDAIIDAREKSAHPPR